MTPFYATAEDAEEAFYEAIARADLDALMVVWSEDEEIVCIHPTGQRLVGARAIRESWRTIFSGNQRLTVHLRRNVQWKGGLLAVHSVIETLYLGDEPTPHGPMLSTNVFQRSANGWRLLSRHTSTGVEGSHAESLGETVSTAGRTLH